MLLRGDTAVALTDRRVQPAQGARNSPAAASWRAKKLMLSRAAAITRLFDRAIDVQISRLRKLVRARSVDTAVHPDGCGLRLRVRADATAATTKVVLETVPRSAGSGASRCCCLLVILVSQATAFYLFPFRTARRSPARQFSDTKLVQLRSLRAALAASDPRTADATPRAVGEAYHARVVPDQERRFVGIPPQNPLLVDLERPLAGRVRPRYGAAASSPVADVLDQAGRRDRHYWAGFQMPPGPPKCTVRALEWSLVIAVVCRQRVCLCPLPGKTAPQLNDAVASVGAGCRPRLCPKTAPLNRELKCGSTEMLSNLRQIEEDRALLLAGVSHDLRTRSRGCVSDRGSERTTKRRGKAWSTHRGDGPIISQFLDFARDGREAPLEMARPERHRRDRWWSATSAPDAMCALCRRARAVPLRAIAFLRLATNLVDNALRHGARGRGHDPIRE